MAIKIKGGDALRMEPAARLFDPQARLMEPAARLMRPQTMRLWATGCGARVRSRRVGH